MIRPFHNVKQALERTWPCKRQFELGPWRIFQSDGGGKRVCAARLAFNQILATTPEIDGAEQALRDLNQPLLFHIDEGQSELDKALAQRGYHLVDPTDLLAQPVADLCDQALPKTTLFEIWPPLIIQKDIWAAGGVSSQRMNVMNRATEAKTSLLIRWKGRAAGTAYLACHGAVIMVHALIISPEQRGQGLAKWAMRKAALWGQSQGCSVLAVACTKENSVAQNLYSSLGMKHVGHYHYRLKGDLR